MGVVMNSVISPEEAGLLLHRWVTEHLPVSALFVCADHSAHITIRGFVNHFTREDDLVICTPLVGQKPLVTVNVTHDIIVGSRFRYTDDTETAKEFEVGSGLQIEMPNGNSLTIMEVRDSQRR